MESVDPEIEVEAAMGGMSDGMYRGHAGLYQLLGDFWSQFEDFHVEFEECIQAGDDAVVAVRTL